MNIGEKIKQRRIELGWSQRELASRIQYKDHSTIGKIENGKVDIPQSKIIRFAEVLNVDIAYLMGWDEKKETPVIETEVSESRQQLINFAQSVPEDKADLMLRVMKSILEDN